MFRDDEQCSRACRTLLAIVRLERLWTPTGGPTAEATAILDAGGANLPINQRALLLAAFAFWNRTGKLSFVEVLDDLDLESSLAVCTLILATWQGTPMIDAWLDYHEPPHLAIH